MSLSSLETLPALISDFIIGNSSAGVREAPVYGVPSININDRQKNRYHHESVVNVIGEEGQLLKVIQSVLNMKKIKPSFHFGERGSAMRFIAALEDEKLWQVAQQKQFVDL